MFHYFELSSLKILIFVCIHACFHVCHVLYVYCIHIYLCIYRYVLVYIYICMRVYIYVCLMYLYICISVYQEFIQIILMSVWRHKTTQLIIEFSNSTFLKCYFKGFWHCSKDICLLGFIYLKLFICPSGVNLSGTSLREPLQHLLPPPLLLRYRAYNTLKHVPAFSDIRKFNLSSKNRY